MMWEYVRLEDDTQVSYSEVREDNTVKVVVERPRDWGFDTAECILPAFNWVSHEGFSEANLKELDDFVRNNAPLILRFAYEGGRVYASLFRLGPYIIFFWTGRTANLSMFTLRSSTPLPRQPGYGLPAPADASWPITRAIFLLGIYAISCSLFHLTMR